MCIACNAATCNCGREWTAVGLDVGSAYPGSPALPCATSAAVPSTVARHLPSRQVDIFVVLLYTTLDCTLAAVTARILDTTRRIRHLRLLSKPPIIRNKTSGRLPQPHTSTLASPRTPEGAFSSNNKAHGDRIWVAHSLRPLRARYHLCTTPMSDVRSA
jgi:hypothetical protein